MQFEEKYPDAPLHYQPSKTSVLKVNSQRKCSYCNCLTTWVDFILETPMCSEECSDARWKEYFKTMPV